MRFEDVYERQRSKRLTCEEAADLLGVCERTFRRYVERYEEEGVQGLYDRRIDKAAHNAAPVDEVFELVELFETRYSDFSIAHFHDKYREKHNGERSYNWVRTQLQQAGVVKKQKKKGSHRKRRARKPMAGMMLHQDGSTHEWLPGLTCDLIVTMDDATSEVYSAILVKEEGTWSSFESMSEVIQEQGLPCTLYTDRGTHYWTTLKAGGKVDKQTPTQFRRAMEQMGIEMIAAYSPEARGRSERMFRTIQGRLPKELVIEGITDMATANTYIKEHFLPALNRLVKKEAEEEESAFVPWIDSTTKLENILCIQEPRTVNKDNTVSYKTKRLQIPKSKERSHYVKAKVKVHEYADGSLAIFHGPRLLGRYDSEGNLKESNDARKLAKAA